MDYKDKLKKGLLEMLLLKILSEHDCYGYQITQIFKKVSKGNIVVREPSMYPILYRLQKRGFISSYKEHGHGRMERIYYHIEKKGLNELDLLITAYEQVKYGVDELLNYQYIEELREYAE